MVKTTWITTVLRGVETEIREEYWIDVDLHVCLDTNGDLEYEKVVLADNCIIDGNIFLSNYEFDLEEVREYLPSLSEIHDTLCGVTY